MIQGCVKAFLSFIGNRPFLLFFSFVGVLLLLQGCAGKEIPYSERPAHVIYGDGLRQLEGGAYEEAAGEFEQFEQQYPYSPWASKAQLMAAYAYYLNNDYTRALGALEGFLVLHPYHMYAPYALFLRGVCYHEQVYRPDRDTQNAQKTIMAFDELLARFGTSVYAGPAKKMRQFAHNHMAAHTMGVGRFYQQARKPIAAYLNFQRALEEFSDTDFLPETLYRLLECSLMMGLWSEAERAVHALKMCNHTYAAMWYDEARDLLGGLQSPRARLLFLMLPAKSKKTEDSAKSHAVSNVSAHKKHA